MFFPNNSVLSSLTEHFSSYVVDLQAVSWQTSGAVMLPPPRCPAMQICPAQCLHVVDAWTEILTSSSTSFNPLAVRFSLLIPHSALCKLVWVFWHLFFCEAWFPSADVSYELAWRFTYFFQPKLRMFEWWIQYEQEHNHLCVINYHRLCSLL